MMSYAYGSGEAIDEYDDPELGVNFHTVNIREETKACANQIFQILDTIHRVGSVRL